LLSMASSAVFLLTPCLAPGPEVGCLPPSLTEVAPSLARCPVLVALTVPNCTVANSNDVSHRCAAPNTTLRRTGALCLHRYF
jgi:hypothetical protein